MKNKCCIAIINHTEKLSDSEKLSIGKAIEVFGDKRDIFIVLPDNIDTNEYEIYSDKSTILKVNNEWLSTYKAYNNTLCSSDFYKLFSDYEYMLIYQTDCWVFEDRLDEFIELNYDYYGAAWPHLQNKVGNGGFSLRKVKKMIEITSKYKFNDDSIESHCDTWFCVTHGDELNICNLKVACNFAIEVPTQKYLNLLDSFPMGLHGKIMMKYWNNPKVIFKKL